MDLSHDGLPAEQILDDIRQLRTGDVCTRGGKVFASVYDPEVPGLEELAGAAHSLAAYLTALDPIAFPSLLAMENALVAAASGLLGGGPDTVGTVTGGGTEALILAVKAARDARPDVAEPRLVAPVTADASFAKAAHYLRMTLDRVPVSPHTLRPDPADVAAAIRPDTVLVACSAPSYPHGVVDAVAPIAAAAAEAGARCHVDACFGGWILPYLRRLGTDVPPFDLSVPGVTSISVDLHKYAYTPKGVSVLLHRDAALRRPQYFAYAGWPGYPMVNPAITNTRPGGPIAAAYAVLQYLGDAGYLELARRTQAAVHGLAKAVSEVDGLRLMAQAESTVVCFTSTDPALDLFVLVDELAARGWRTQPQFTLDTIPPSIHMTVTSAVAPHVELFAADLAAAATATRIVGPAHPPAGVPLPDVLTTLATTPGRLPQRMAPFHALLNALPPDARAALMVDLFGLLQRPTPS